MKPDYENYVEGLLRRAYAAIWESKYYTPDYCDDEDCSVHSCGDSAGCPTDEKTMKDIKAFLEAPRLKGDKE